MDYNTWQYYVKSIDIEPKISKAIHFVTTGEPPAVYHATGSGEYPIPEELISQFEMSNYEMKEFNAVTEEVPEDCDMLMLTMPERDWSIDEADRIQKYLYNGGTAMLLLGYRTERFTNLNDTLGAFGVSLGDYVVVEGDANYYYMNRPNYLVPRFAEHDITNDFIGNNYRSLQINATGVDKADIVPSSVRSIDPLIVTSNSAYGKSDTQSLTINKEPGDKDGPFSLAVAVSASYYTTDTIYARLAVFGGGDVMIEGSVNDVVGGTNYDMLINAADWLYGQESSIYIPSKGVPSVERLQMTQGQANMIFLFSVAVLPIVIIAAGLIVWLRRRHS
jgi:ABC-2 type transport system permease protein